MTKPPAPQYFVVTDLWFDPVVGQHDEIAGRMAAIQWIAPNGTIVGDKRAHTIRGLASQGYLPADMDYFSFCKARQAAKEGGIVVGIGMGKIIRNRPKTPGCGR